MLVSIRLLLHRLSMTVGSAFRVRPTSFGLRHELRIVVHCEAQTRPAHRARATARASVCTISINPSHQFEDGDEGHRDPHAALFGLNQVYEFDETRTLEVARISDMRTRTDSRSAHWWCANISTLHHVAAPSSFPASIW
jgi:hypothetical protein